MAVFTVEDIMTAAEFLFDCDRGSKKKFLEALRERLELTFWEHEETRKDLREELNGAECEVRSVRDELREAHDKLNERDAIIEDLQKQLDELEEVHVKLKEALK